MFSLDFRFRLTPVLVAIACYQIVAMLLRFASTAEKLHSSSKDDLQKILGAMVHAQSISSILDMVLDHEPLIRFWSFPIGVIWILAWSLVGITLALYLRHPLWFSDDRVDNSSPYSSNQQPPAKSRLEPREISGSGFNPGLIKSKL
ncbi:CHASE2 domain-containing protein [Leptolyngbya boryana FACHB-1624]|uniref:CHASE2 domain-containing protein n=2 Tax=Leptolyngbya TaxID=47251 RepID=UPI0016857933|nr:CHASE2 domain-containing protein [Leptolyngbya sp. FACHB-1624]MBD1856097.1 CHASE2 domain-containing protein [Leptolyngbya sp. FACHB-1624]